MSRPENRVLFVILDNYKTERLGVQILSAIALEEGYARALLIVNSMPFEEALRKARDFRPGIVAYSCMSYEHTKIQEFNRRLKISGLKFLSIFGGHHYTFNPEAMISDENIDVLCRGEGESAFRSFIRSVRDGQTYDAIDKLWVRRENRVIKNKPGVLIDDLDSIPFADRRLIPQDRIFGFLGQGLNLLFGRGCPYACSYCFNARYNELFSNSRILFHRSVENVMREIKQAMGYLDFKAVFFRDDSFTYLPEPVIKEFCGRYKKEIQKPFFAQLRANTVSEDTIKVMRDAGLFGASVGVECSDEEVCRGVLNRHSVTNRDIVKTFQTLHKYGIKTYSQNLMALPVPDPLSVDLATIRFNIKLKPTWSLFNIVLPIPGTPLWDHLVERGRLDKDRALDPDKSPSNFIATLLKFGRDQGAADRINNLHKFASIAVKFPFLLPLVKVLIRLPPNRVYQYIFLLWYGYWQSIGLYDVKFSIRLVTDGVKEIHNYLRQH